MRKVLYILGLLEDTDLNWLVGVGRRQKVARGDTIVQEGKNSGNLYIVVTGMLDVSVRGRIVASIGAGEVVGEISLLDSRPPSATVAASEETVVLTVPIVELRAKLARDLGFAARLYQALGVFLATRLRNLNLQLIVGGDSGVKLAEDEEEMDEIDPEVLERVTLAGSRFKWIMEKLGSS